VKGFLVLSNESSVSLTNLHLRPLERSFSWTIAGSMFLKVQQSKMQCLKVYLKLWNTNLFVQYLFERGKILRRRALERVLFSFSTVSIYGDYRSSVKRELRRFPFVYYTEILRYYFPDLRQSSFHGNLTFEIRHDLLLTLFIYLFVFLIFMNYIIYPWILPISLQYPIILRAFARNNL
jgi:hypothetical protein